MKEILTSILEVLGLAWWVEVVTENPNCTYYFGPFVSSEEAKSARGGYVEDLERESAQGIRVAVKRCKPSNLTVFDESAETNRQKLTSPVMSGQL